jgi:hypothetical protein
MCWFVLLVFIAGIIAGVIVRAMCKSFSRVIYARCFRVLFSCVVGALIF